MTDLRTALIEACDIAETLYTEFNELERVRLGRAMVDASDVPEHLERLRSLATSPPTVLDALRDPEVRAGRVWIEYELAFDSTQPARVRRLRVMPGTFLGLIQSQSRAGDEWYDLTLGVADLDAPCRLVPAEGGGE